MRSHWSPSPARSSREALRTLSPDQQLYQEAKEPTVRYFELLAAAITSGRAHVASLDGSLPEDADAWGWKRIDSGFDSAPRWQSQCELVGWIAEREAGNGSTSVSSSPLSVIRDLVRTPDGQRSYRVFRDFSRRNGVSSGRGENRDGFRLREPTHGVT